MKDMTEKISSLYPDLSKGQKKVADFVMEHYDKAAFYTAAKLSDKVGISESTVVRFAIVLGYDGYSHFQKDLQDRIRNKLTSLQRIEMADGIGEKDIIKTVMSADYDKIKKTFEDLSREAFGGAVDAILKAENIYILGLRSSATLAGFMSFYFHLMFENVRLVHTDSVSDMLEQMLRIGKRDVVIGISFPRYSKRTIQALDFASSKGSTVIVISDSPASPIVKYATHSLIAYSGMVSFVDSLVAPLSLINALIAALGICKKQELSSSFEYLESIWDEYGVYEKE